MRIREPAVAGRFYPGDRTSCVADVDQMLASARERLPEAVEGVAGLVPHAGWVFSGCVAADVFAALESDRSPRSVILFGGVHRGIGSQAALFGDGRWETPLGTVDIDDRLAERILGQTNLIADDPFCHENEHSIEVQVPFVQRVFPNAKIVPIMVMPGPRAFEVGEAVGRTLRAYDYDAVVVGTTDLTHYGPNYGFTPRGVGAKGHAWAKDTNDRRFVDMVCSMQGDRVVEEAARNRNACSAGAVAATMATAGALGATKGTLLAHTSSAEVMGERGQDASDSVGYAGIVFS